MRDLRPALKVRCLRARPALGPDGEIALAEAALRAAIARLAAHGRLVYVSSGSVLRGWGDPHGEATAVRPAPSGADLAGYVNGKILGERLSFPVVRRGPTCGRDARTEATLAARRAGRSTLRPVNLRRTWVHVEDLTEAILAAVRAGASGILWAAAAVGGPSARDR